MRFARWGTMSLALAVLLVSCDQPVTDAEASLFVSPQQYAVYGVALPEDESPFVKVTHTLQADLSTRLQYEYQPEGESDISYMMQEIENSHTFIDSAVRGGITDWVRDTVYESGGLKVVKTDEYHYNADTHTFQLVNKEGGVVGNILQVGWGKIRYNATVVGISIGNPDVWEEVFGETLAAIEAHKW